MTNSLNRIPKTFLITTFILISINGFSQFRKLENRKHNINKIIKEVAEDPDFKNAQFAFLSIDLNSGEIIAQHNPDMALKPASTQKLISTATLLELYGPEYKFETKLQYTGEIDTANYILEGNIIILGGGDPSLGSKYFEATSSKHFLDEWVNAIAQLGIDSVAGRIVADASIYSSDIVPATWTWQDIGNYYGAGANGLSVFDNYYTIYFNSGSLVGDTTTISKTVPNISLTFDNGVTADSISHDNTYIFGAPYNYNRYVRGEIPLNRKDFTVKGSIPDPAYIAAKELELALKEKGVKINIEASSLRLLKLEGLNISSQRQTVHTTYSPLLQEIIKKTNVHSINLYAEHCLNHSGIKLGVIPDTDNSSAAIEDYWESMGMDTQGLSLNDGSGLSHHNVITPRQMIYLLDYMKNKSPYYSEFYNSMAVAGVSGTLRNMFKNTPAQGQLRAKSGTINRVKAYAGYVTSASGREIAFSMVANNFSCSSGEARRKLEKIMIELANFSK